MGDSLSESDQKSKITVASTSDREAEFDLREYAGAILAGWPYVLAFALVGLIVAAYLAWSQAPIYQSNALMQVENGQNMAPTSFMAAQGQELAGARGNNQTTAESAILKSRSVIGKAVIQDHLQVEESPRFFPIIGEPIARLRSTLFSTIWSPPLISSEYSWGNESIRVTRVVIPPDAESASFVLVSGSGGQYRLNSESGKTILTGRVGRTESGVLTNVGKVKIFVQKLNASPGTKFDIRSVSRESAVASLQRRLTVVEKPQGSGLMALSLDASSPRAAEIQLNAVMNAYLEQNVEQQSEQAQRRLAFLQKQLPKLKEQRDSAQSRLAAYQSKTGTLDLSAQANAVLQQLTNLDQQLAEVDLQRQQLLQEYTPRAPQVQAAADKIKALQTRQGKLQSKLKDLPKNESKFLELRRNVEVNDQLYTQMLNTSQGLQVSKAGITGITHIVDDAYAKSSKISPERTRIMALGMLLGAVIGVLFVLGRALLRTTISDPNEIESQFGLPVFATVPFSEWESKVNRVKRKLPLLATAQPNDPTVESLRSFRTSLQFAMIEGETKLVGITGPTPGCGKSFIASNLAALTAQSDNKVLLIDADLRRGLLHRLFDVRRDVGLGEVLSGDCSPCSAIKHSGIENLDVMLLGKRPPNPAELLMSTRFEQMLEDLSGRYDYIVFDLPPVLNVADANIVSKRMGAIFLTIRSDHSTSHEVEQAISRLAKDGMQISGAIFNGLLYNSLRYGYSKYRYYGYSY